MEPDQKEPQPTRPTRYYVSLNITDGPSMQWVFADEWEATNQIAIAMRAILDTPQSQMMRGRREFSIRINPC